MEGNQGGNVEAGTGDPRRKAIYWLALHGLRRLLSYTTRATCSGVGITHRGLGPPTSTKKMSHRFSYRLI